MDILFRGRQTIIAFQKISKNTKQIDVLTLNRVMSNEAEISNFFNDL